MDTYNNMKDYKFHCTIISGQSSSERRKCHSKSGESSIERKTCHRPMKRIMTKRIEINMSTPEHISIKYIIPNNIEIHRIDSKAKMADMSTKGSTRVKFELQRILRMGW